ncbi:hypothetical protein JTB14_006949 [Gonioctena quinquepunctata]|nr:hypothetical protein JTB14_006949 [Gonioctena quinquepunctata]
MVSEAVLYFPDLVTAIEELDMEWRLLPEVDILSGVEEADYCETVSLLKNDPGDGMFPNSIKFVNGTLAYPHSSAAAERVFSKLSLIKTKTRKLFEGSLRQKTKNG